MFDLKTKIIPLQERERELFYQLDCLDSERRSLRQELEDVQQELDAIEAALDAIEAAENPRSGCCG
jgi:hypothetical protein